MSDKDIESNGSSISPSSISSKNEEQEIEELLTGVDLTASDTTNDPQPSTVPGPCSKCGQPTVDVCLTCHAAICDDHKSTIDPSFCCHCLNESTAQTEILPDITDAEGIHHKGREIIPKGPFFGTSCKRISEMTSYELEAHIQHYKDEVRKGERFVDHARVMLGMGQIEQNERLDEIRKNHPGRYKSKTNGVILDLPGQQKTKSQKRDAKDPTQVLAEGLKMSKENAAAFLAAFTQLMKK